MNQKDKSQSLANEAFRLSQSMSAADVAEALNLKNEAEARRRINQGKRLIEKDRRRF